MKGPDRGPIRNGDRIQRIKSHEEVVRGEYPTGMGPSHLSTYGTPVLSMLHSDNESINEDTYKERATVEGMRGVMRSDRTERRDEGIATNGITRTMMSEAFRLLLI